MAVASRQVVMGVPELKRALREFEGSSGRRIVRPALRKAGIIGARIVKQSIPGRYKSVRRAIGYRNITTKRKEMSVKIGAAVGATAQKVSVKNREAGRPGVGIDGRNIHWWFLGTETRTTGTKRKRVGGKRGRGGWKGTATRVDTGAKKKNTGRMPPQSEPIAVIITRNAGTIKETIRTWLAVGVNKEAERIKTRLAPGRVR